MIDFKLALWKELCYYTEVQAEYRCHDSDIEIMAGIPTKKRKVFDTPSNFKDWTRLNIFHDLWKLKDTLKMILDIDFFNGSFGPKPL